MRGLKNNGRLLCSPGTSFAPLGLDGANTQTHPQTHTRTWRLLDQLGPVQWGRVGEKSIFYLISHNISWCTSVLVECTTTIQRQNAVLEHSGRVQWQSAMVLVLISSHTVFHSRANVRKGRVAQLHQLCSPQEETHGFDAMFALKYIKNIQKFQQYLLWVLGELLSPPWSGRNWHSSGWRRCHRQGER